MFHLIQDKIWYQYLNEFKKDFEGEHEEFANRIYSDMNICDKYILNKFDIDKENFLDIKQKLEGRVSSEKIKKYIDKSLKIRTIENEKVYFIEENVLEKYIEHAICECKKEYIDIKERYKNG